MKESSVQEGGVTQTPAHHQNVLLLNYFQEVGDLSSTGEKRKGETCPSHITVAKMQGALSLILFEKEREPHP